MMDMTYDAGAGGGWGEFGASQTTSAPAQAKPNALERLPFPVTVKTLTEIPTGEERVVVGSLSFATVRVVGIVDRVSSSNDGGSSTEYCIKDCDNPDCEFTIINYIGLGEDARDSFQFSEGTRIHAVGKLRSFDGRLVIVAFQVREVESEEEVVAFALESKIGRHFFANNLHETQPGQDMSKYDDTILSTHCRQSGNRAANTTFGGHASAVPTTPGPAQPSYFTSPPAKRSRTDAAPVTGDGIDADKKGLSGQRARIFQYIVSHSEPEVGVDVRNAKAALGGGAGFDDDVAFLVDDGHIYNTHDDNHYAPI